MIALRKLSPTFGVSIVEVASPEPARGEVLLEVEAVGICGSDLHIYDAKGTAYSEVWSRLPITLGHEFCGRVVQLGPEVGPEIANRRVVVQPTGGIGLYRNGAFAPLVAVPARNCLPISDSLHRDLGALVEPLAVSEGAVVMAETRPGQRLLIMGAGPVAQGAAIFARLAGASQIVITGYADPHRFEVLRQMGFDLLIDRAEPGSQARLTALAGDGFDAAIELTGVAATIDEGLHLLRRNGVLVATGIHPDKAAIDVTRLVRQQKQLRGCYGNTLEGWRRVISCVTDRPELFRPLVTHRFSLRDGVQAFETAYSRTATKALIYPLEISL